MSALRKGIKRPVEVGKKISIAKKGVKTGIVPMNSFKKGQAPWNKGKPGYKLALSQERREELSRQAAFIGRLPWSMDRRERHRQRILLNPIRLGTTTSKEAGAKLSASQKNRFAGDKNKHPRWIADRSKLNISNVRPMNDWRAREWSRAIKNRDGWRCKIVNDNCSGKLEAHHILPWSKFPELRYELNNGITLCHFLHPKKRDDEMKLSPYFQQLVASRG